MIVKIQFFTCLLFSSSSDVVNVIVKIQFFTCLLFSSSSDVAIFSVDRMYLFVFCSLDSD